MDPLKTFPVIVEREPPELLVADEVTPCPYIDDQRSRMPLRLPIRPLQHSEWEVRLEQGDRRHGAVLYRTTCPTCRACEPIRVDVRKFEFSRNQLRVLRRGKKKIDIEFGLPQITLGRLELYEKHLQGRGLCSDDHVPISPARYRNFLVESCCDSFEIRYSIDGELMGVALTDRADHSLSAHYTFYDPIFQKLSIGTFSILKQIELCKEWDLDYLYLGLFVEANDSMSYKSRYKPHERFINGKWVLFDRDSTG